MSIIDSTIIITYLVLMILIGIYANKKQKDMEDYYVAGRKVGVFSITCLWLSSWIGGASVIGSSSKAYDIGISSIWYSGSVAIGCILFSYTFSGIIKKIGDKNKHMTYPDFIEDRYDSRSRIIATITTILAYIAYTSSQLVAASSIMHILIGWELSTCFIVSTIIIVLYTSIGGFLAVTYTDWVQFILLILGVVVIGIPLAHQSIGGFSSFSQLPKSYFEIGAWGWSTIIALGVSQIFTVYTSMDSYTRCFSAKDVKTAKKGTIYAALGIIVIAIASTYLGLATKIIYPNLESSTNALTIFILKAFPSGLKGLALVGILAAVMSTADICILTASANVTNDIYLKYLKKEVDDKKLLKISIITSGIIGIVSAIMAWKMLNIINILFIAFTINSAGLFFPTVLGVFWEKSNANASFYSMTLALITVLTWYVAHGGIFDIDPLWPGLIVSFVTFVGISVFTTPTEREKEKSKRFINIIK